mgnify:CR=1 FL=1
MASFYEKIIIDMPPNARYEPQYFRVGYYGQGFPLEFRNQEFIYRGQKNDHITVFTERIQVSLWGLSISIIIIKKQTKQNKTKNGATVHRCLGLLLSFSFPLTCCAFFFIF